MDESNDYDERHAYALVPISHGALAPGAVGGVLEQTRLFGLQKRQETLREHGLPMNPEGDVVIICCAPDTAWDYAKLIHHALEDREV